MKISAFFSVVLVACIFSLTVAVSPNGFNWIVQSSWAGSCLNGSAVSISVVPGGCTQDATSVLTGVPSYDFRDCNSTHFIEGFSCQDSNCTQDCIFDYTSLTSSASNMEVCTSNSASESSAVLCSTAAAPPALPAGYFVQTIYAGENCSGAELFIQASTLTLGVCINESTLSSKTDCVAGTSSVSVTVYKDSTCTGTPQIYDTPPQCQSYGDGSEFAECSFSPTAPPAPTSPLTTASHRNHSEAGQLLASLSLLLATLALFAFRS